MAIAKMNLVNVIGRTEDFDRICAKYLLHCDMHMENAVGTLDNIAGLTPYSDEGADGDLLARVETVYRRAGFTPTVLPEAELGPNKGEACEQTLAQINEKMFSLEAERESLDAQIQENERVIAQLKPLLSIDNVDVDSFFHFDFVKFRFGRMPKKSMQTLEGYLYHIDAFFIKTSEDDDYVWGMYFMPALLEEKIDAVFASLYFERTRISDKAHGTAKEATVTLELENERLKTRRRQIDHDVKAALDQNLGELNAIYSSLLLRRRIGEIKRYAAHTRDSFYVVAWMDNAQTEKLMRAVKGESDVVIVTEKPETVDKVKPPTRLKNSVFVRPFELFVRMYGTPGYHEIDPTGIVALTYFLMFGIMFGDVGQGIVITLIGFLFGWLKKSSLGKIIGIIGISSTIFGFVYGSVFGYEDILPGLIHPMEKMNFMLIAAVALGVVILGFAMVLNIINAIKAKDAGRALFSQNGLAGLVFYFAAIIVGLSLFLNFGFQIAPWLIGICLVVPLVLIFLQEPLSLLVEKKKDWMPKQKGMFIVEKFFELFEILLSFVTNTMSFIRVGAFALNHVGMMSVVFLLSDMAQGGSIVVQVLGNALVIGLEGLIVGIQVLRLEYYEMFSRFFVGDGKEFQNINQK